MLKNLCLTECPLKFLAKKWGLKEDSPEFASKLLKIFPSFSKSEKTEKTCRFIANSKLDISKEKETSCMASFPPAASLTLKSQSPVPNAWDEKIKCVLKIDNKWKGAILGLKTTFKKIILKEEESAL